MNGDAPEWCHQKFGLKYNIKCITTTVKHGLPDGLKAYVLAKSRF